MKIDSTNMQIGQVLSIKGKRNLQLVVFCEVHESPSFDGSYFVYQFQTIDFKPPTNNDKVVINNPQIHHFYIENNSMIGKGKPLSWNDVSYVKQTKFKKEISVSFTY